MISTVQCEETSVRLYIFAAVLGFIPLTATAQTADSGPPCQDKITTIDLVECINKDTAVWDKRLNAAYKALTPTIEPAQRDPLRTAERLWVQYRNANCTFYSSRDGTMYQIEGAECVRTMTRERALELEKAAKS
jgi:uncharacterized protein YecT (DUF1311 family)